MRHFRELLALVGVGAREASSLESVGFTWSTIGTCMATRRELKRRAQLADLSPRPQPDLRDPTFHDRVARLPRTRLQRHRLVGDVLRVVDAVALDDGLDPRVTAPGAGPPGASQA